MNLSAQNQPRLLPFDREHPGSWQRWEDFWVDFLNAEPLLPWPGNPVVLKRVVLAKKFGISGGKQRGIDILAHMDDGSILAVQCKDYAKYTFAKGIAAMDKAEKEFSKADAYFLVLSEKGIPSGLELEALRRGNWLVISLETLSSWFFSEKFLHPHKQKNLVKNAFGLPVVRQLFPLSGDNLLISPESFFKQKNLIPHEAQFQGETCRVMAESLATVMGGSGPRVAILTATGGQGKTRMLKAVADWVNERFPPRIVRFQNDSADLAAEEYSLRAEDFKNTSIFIDDAHRLENLRIRLLRQVSESPSATMLIAARPNSTEALKTRLLESGFQEKDLSEFQLPTLDRAGRRALAVEILGEDDGQTPNFLAAQSEQCPLVCTVGAELIRMGKIDLNLLVSEDFKRRVFDHLINSTLESLFANDALKRERAERILRIISMMNPVEVDSELFKWIARLEHCQPWDIERLIPQLESAGLLRNSRGKLRVVPDLLADHLVYDTAYGNGKMPSLVREVTSISTKDTFTSLFANLAEAEWRAKQEGMADTYLDGMWNNLRSILLDPKDPLIFGLLNAWRRIAIFQPERTLELARIFLNHEAARIAAGIAKVRYQDFRYDSISMHLGMLPDLLAPVAMYHRPHRMEAFELLWQIGDIKDGPTHSTDELPAAWQTIAKTASFALWEKGGPQDAFKWLTSWVLRPEGKALLKRGGSFLSIVASQWFGSRFHRPWKEGEAVRNFTNEIEEFRNEILNWIDTEIISTGTGPCWSIRKVIYEAGNRRLAIADAQEGAIDPLTAKSIKILSKVLALYDDPVLRFSVWQYLSKQAAKQNQGKLKIEWLELRNSITLNLPFQLVRLASSFAFDEWNHEQLKKWGNTDGYELCAQWWSDLASQTVIELRRIYPTICESMEQLDQVGSLLFRFRQRASWDAVAEAWAMKFPSERNAVLEEMMVSPEHTLVPCLGYFLGLVDEINCDAAGVYSLRALSHPEGRIRRAVLLRLSWRDVKRIPLIADRLKEMSASKDPDIASDMANFVSLNQFEASPYFDEVLSALNVSVLSISELIGVAEAVTRLLEHTEHTISSNLLATFFQRLELEEDLDKVFPDHVSSVFHKRFPIEMFRVYLSRIRAGKYLPWLLDKWFLSGLPEHLGDLEFEKTARDLFDETIRADHGHFHSFSQLFEVSVARVKPKFAAKLLAEELRRQPQEAQALERIVDLSGAGHGSVVYEAPDYTKQLLNAIHLLPAVKVKELRDQLIFGAIPHHWSSTGGSVDEEYLWAKNRAAQLAEHHRSITLLREFYLAIVKNQEDFTNQIRCRSRNDD